MFTTSRLSVKHCSPSSPIFAGCTKRQLRSIQALCARATMRTGRTLAREGRLGRELGIIVAGSAIMTVDGRPVAMLGSGDIYGESALLAVGADRIHTATVTATSDAVVDIFSVAEFNTMLADLPQVAARIRTLAGDRRAVLAAGTDDPDTPRHPWRLPADALTLPRSQPAETAEVAGHIPPSCGVLNLDPSRSTGCDRDDRSGTSAGRPARTTRRRTL
jgi:hypothetical protein